MLRRTLPALLLLCACQSTESASVSGPNAAPVDVEGLLRAYASQSGYDITYDQDTAELLRSLTLTPIGPESGRVLKLARAGGRSAEETSPAHFEVVALRFATAPELAATLRNLVAAASAGGTEPAVQVVADARTNSLLVSAPPGPMEKVRHLIATLDREVVAGP